MAKIVNFLYFLLDLDIFGCALTIKASFMVFGFHKYSVIWINRSRSTMLMQAWHCAHLITILLLDEALALTLTFIILEKLLNRVNLEKTEYVIIKTVYFVINTKSYSSLVSLCSCRKRLLSARNS